VRTRLYKNTLPGSRVQRCLAAFKDEPSRKKKEKREGRTAGERGGVGDGTGYQKYLTNIFKARKKGSAVNWVDRRTKEPRKGVKT